SINSTLDRLVRSGGVVGVTTLSAPERGAPAPLTREPAPIPQVEEPLPEDYQPMMIAGQAAPVAEAKVAAPPMPKLPTQDVSLPTSPLDPDDDLPTRAEPRRASAPARGAKSALPPLPQLDAIPLDAAPAPSKPRPAPRPGQPPATPRAMGTPVATPLSG